MKAFSNPSQRRKSQRQGEHNPISYEHHGQLQSSSGPSRASIASETQPLMSDSPSSSMIIDQSHAQPEQTSPTEQTAGDHKGLSTLDATVRKVRSFIKPRNLFSTWSFGRGTTSKGDSPTRATKASSSRPLASEIFPQPSTTGVVESEVQSSVPAARATSPSKRNVDRSDLPSVVQRTLVRKPIDPVTEGFVSRMTTGTGQEERLISPAADFKQHVPYSDHEVGTADYSKQVEDPEKRKDSAFPTTPRQSVAGGVMDRRASKLSATASAAEPIPDRSETADPSRYWPD